MAYSNCLKKVIELIGHQASIRLVRAKGGKHFSFPKIETLNDTHWLVTIVGFENAKKLCEHYQSDKIKLPIEVNALIQLRNASIALDYQEGVSISQLADSYQIDRKLVQNILDSFLLRGNDYSSLELDFG